MCSVDNYILRFNNTIESTLDSKTLNLYYMIHECASYVRNIFNMQFFLVILFNTLNIYILHSKRSKNRNNILSIFTAIADIAIVISLMLIFWIHECQFHESEASFFCIFFNWFRRNNTNYVNISATTLSIFSNTATMSSTWGVLVISIDRLRAIRHPFKIIRKGIFKDVCVVIISIVFFTFISNLTRYWETKMATNITITYDNSIPYYAKVDYLKLTLNGIRIFLHIIVPLILLTITNSMLIFHLKNRSKYFETAKWDRAKRSFDSGISCNKNTDCLAKVWSRKDASKEFKITIMMVLLITFHITSFFPTMLFHLYFEIIVPVMSHYFQINIDKMSYPIHCDNKITITTRKDLAYLTITILVFGKISNSLLLCNLPNSIYKICQEIFIQKTLTTSLTTRCENSNVRKVSRPNASSRKVTRQENKSLIMPLTHLNQPTYPC
ncbi:G protein-coupled receptor, rhodopsin-like family and GPCR, rhodopsin-like, 7TM domain-containing protein [Strongyloides ratti]|uniref:G protein-coupled receptor, rhodopsin-like family and GPCR, rhodopsin-like, 7TM domain-containing protein n=1 Tax=Strongyloides ratti TaxID=34506 RepID=A0A090LH71_STRRB|nr:G protein-coupled receptor, rhodopsin-like family and GPCR, rhodopsin-like, 7TM domain-containing protein [Strongyloides ratti]CEF69141.1 G protein-coupled receptor, rhodopsin-like family and GPCR, rhodopsin-like, 7TM domain-containing protein [Strongyloides ratti]